MRLVRGCLVLLLLLVRTSAGMTQENSLAGKTSSLAAGHPKGPIKLDGKLDEPAWSATDIAELAQQSPRPGQVTPYKTTARVLVTSDYIYFGFECQDPDPSKIAVHSMLRDGDMGGDDTVAVVLDTYGDQRTGYLFRINTEGARVDGLIAGLSEPSLDWDGIWDARAARGKDGWSAEIAIPFRTLSFKTSLFQWNINLERFVARDRTVLRWASPTLDSFLYDLNRTGKLTGIEGLKQGLGLDISPYIIGRMKDQFRESSRIWQGSPGVDLTYRITPQIAAVFTANTDFAETEVDSRQINLTRFPLFFPERRSFFLEGSNQFQFGLGLSETFIPFFSRQVGLYEGQQIPIDTGFKLSGRSGRWNMGVMDVQTRSTLLSETNSMVPGTNLFAGRATYDVNPQLRVGTIFTNGRSDGIRSNRLTGFDAVWRTSEFLGNKNFQAGGWTAFSAGDLASGNRTGWGIAVNYPSDLLNCSASLNQFGEALDPGLGFLPRPGTRRLDAACTYQPRPSKDGPFRWVRQQFMEHEFYHVTNYQGIVESWRFFWAPINIRLENGDHLEFNWVPWYEYLPEPFEIASRVTLPVGGYRFDRFRLEYQSSRHRAWEFGTTSWFGSFYNGRLWQQSNYLRFTSPSGRWQAGISTEHDFGHLPQGNFVQRLWQINLAYAFSPNLVVTNFLQYDTESQNMGNNLRLRWTLKPGNDLFIVWNRGWQRLLVNRSDWSLIPDRDLLAVKLRWTFRR